MVELDTANGVLVPYYDPDTEMMYLAAKVFKSVILSLDDSIFLWLEKH